MTNFAQMNSYILILICIVVFILRTKYEDAKLAVDNGFETVVVVASFQMVAPGTMHVYIMSHLSWGIFLF